LLMPCSAPHARAPHGAGRRADIGRPDGGWQRNARTPRARTSTRARRRGLFSRIAAPLLAPPSSAPAAHRRIASRSAVRDLLHTISKGAPACYTAPPPASAATRPVAPRSGRHCPRASVERGRNPTPTPPTAASHPSNPLPAATASFTRLRARYPDDGLPPRRSRPAPSPTACTLVPPDMALSRTQHRMNVEPIVVARRARRSTRSSTGSITTHRFPKRSATFQPEPVATRS